MCITRLQEVQVVIISNTACKARNSLYNMKVFDTMLCAEDDGKVLLFPAIIAT